jgi:hypothetical protein
MRRPAAVTPNACAAIAYSKSHTSGLTNRGAITAQDREESLSGHATTQTGRPHRAGQVRTLTVSKFLDFPPQTHGTLRSSAYCRWLFDKRIARGGHEPPRHRFLPPPAWKFRPIRSRINADFKGGAVGRPSPVPASLDQVLVSGWNEVTSRGSPDGSHRAPLTRQPADGLRVSMACTCPRRSLLSRRGVVRCC